MPLAIPTTSAFGRNVAQGQGNIYGDWTSWLFRPLDFLGHSVRSTIYGVASGNWTPFIENLKVWDDLERDEYVSGQRMMKSLGFDTSQYKVDLPLLGESDVLGFAAEILTDPLTYMSFGATKAGKVAAQNSIAAASEAVSGFSKLKGVLKPSERVGMLVKEFGDDAPELIAKFVTTKMDDAYRTAGTLIDDAGNYAGKSAAQAAKDMKKYMEAVNPTIAKLDDATFMKGMIGDLDIAKQAMNAGDFKKATEQVIKYASYDDFTQLIGEAARAGYNDMSTKLIAGFGTLKQRVTKGLSGPAFMGKPLFADNKTAASFYKLAFDNQFMKNARAGWGRLWHKFDDPILQKLARTQRSLEKVWGKEGNDMIQGLVQKSAMAGLDDVERALAYRMADHSANVAKVGHGIAERGKDIRPDWDYFAKNVAEEANELGLKGKQYTEFVNKKMEMVDVYHSQMDKVKPELDLLSKQIRLDEQKARIARDLQEIGRDASPEKVDMIVHYGNDYAEGVERLQRDILKSDIPNLNQEAQDALEGLIREENEAVRMMIDEQRSILAHQQGRASKELLEKEMKITGKIEDVATKQVAKQEKRAAQFEKQIGKVSEKAGKKYAGGKTPAPAGEMEQKIADKWLKLHSEEDVVKNVSRVTKDIMKEVAGDHPVIEKIIKTTPGKKRAMEKVYTQIVKGGDLITAKKITEKAMRSYDNALERLDKLAVKSGKGRGKVYYELAGEQDKLAKQILSGADEKVVRETKRRVSLLQKKKVESEMVADFFANVETKQQKAVREGMGELQERISRQRAVASVARTQPYVPHLYTKEVTDLFERIPHGKTTLMGALGDVHSAHRVWRNSDDIALSINDINDIASNVARNAVKDTSNIPVALTKQMDEIDAFIRNPVSNISDDILKAEGWTQSAGKRMESAMAGDSNAARVLKDMDYQRIPDKIANAGDDAVEEYLKGKGLSRVEIPGAEMYAINAKVADNFNSYLSQKYLMDLIMPEGYRLKEIVDNPTAQHRAFADKVLKNWEKGKFALVEENPFIAMSQFAKDKAKSVASDDFWGQVKTIFGKRTVMNPPAHYRKVAGSMFEGYSFPPKIANAIEREARILSNPTKMNWFKKTTDKINRSFKYLATRIWPRYWARNFASDNYLSWLGDGFSVESRNIGQKIIRAEWEYSGLMKLGKFDEAEKVMKRLAKTNIKTKTGTMNLYDLFAEAKATGAWGGQMTHGYGAEMTDEVANILIDLGRKGRKIDGLSKGNRKKVMDALEKYTTGAENWTRVSHYVARRQAGDSAYVASRSVFDHLFDYGDVGSGDKFVESFAWFWRWRKNNLGLFARLAVDKPRVLTTLQRAVKHSWDDKTNQINADMLPDYIDGKALRVADKDGQPGIWFGDAWIPQMEIFGMAQGLKRKGVLGGTAKVFTDVAQPIIKIPVELATNRNFFTDKPIERYPGEQKEFMGQYLPGLLSDPGLLHATQIPLGTIDRFYKSSKKAETTGGKIKGLAGELLGLKVSRTPTEVYGRSNMRKLVQMRNDLSYKANKAAKEGDMDTASEFKAKVKAVNNRINALKERLKE